MQRLAAGDIQQPSSDDAFFKRVMEITGDPLPYGLSANRLMLEAVVRHAASRDHQRAGGDRGAVPSMTMPTWGRTLECEPLLRFSLRSCSGSVRVLLRVAVHARSVEQRT